MWPHNNYLTMSAGQLYDRIVDSIEQSRRRDERLREWAGELLDEMLTGREASVRLLKHDSASVRRCALVVLTQYWGVRPDDEEMDSIYRVAVDDPDNATQGIAIRALAFSCAHTNDAKIARSFAAIVRDDGRPRDIRTYAYYGLFQLFGLRIPILEGTSLATKEKRSLPRVPEDVDWRFVEGFLDETGASLPPNRYLPAVWEHDHEVLISRYGGQMAYSLGKYQEAVVRLSKAIQLRKTDIWLYYLRAMALSGLNQFADAIADLEIVIHSLPDCAPAYEERAKAYRGLGVEPKAKSDERVAAKLRSRRSPGEEKG